MVFLGRRLFYILFCAVVLLTALAWTLLKQSPLRITFSSTLSERINHGIKKPEAEAILGCAPGDYRTGPSMPVPISPATDAYYDEWWLSDEGQIGIKFDEDLRVVDVRFFSLDKDKDVSLICRLLWSVGVKCNY
jgi:hypothetical protein